MIYMDFTLPFARTEHVFTWKSFGKSTRGSALLILVLIICNFSVARAMSECHQ